MDHISNGLQFEKTGFHLHNYLFVQILVLVIIEKWLLCPILVIQNMLLLVMDRFNYFSIITFGQNNHILMTTGTRIVNKKLFLKLKS